MIGKLDEPLTPIGVRHKQGRTRNATEVLLDVGHSNAQWEELERRRVVSAVPNENPTIELVLQADASRIG